MENKLFTILDSIESTNNYAMAQAHAALATHGQAWFANEQWGGRGQRGKHWVAEKGQNIILTITIKPDTVFTHNPFYFNAYIACMCRRFVATNLPNNTVQIKWPNDIFINDNKAGGILIENVYQGKNWKWAVVGIGINVNQTVFEGGIKNATSFALNNNITYYPVELALQLYKIIMDGLAGINIEQLPKIITEYNLFLFKKNETVALKIDNRVLKTTIAGVNEFGQLFTNNGLEQLYNFGDVEWVL